MTTSTHYHPIHTYNNYNFKNPPAINKTSISTAKEPLIFSHIPYSTIRTTVENNSSLSPSPNTVRSTSKRLTSITSLGNFFPRRKSQQMTALASQRQSLWMNISKNAQSNHTHLSPLLLQQQRHINVMRKKILRLLLVFSYLLSISLFAIALATFYGFFWSGNSTMPTATSISNISLRSPLPSNPT